jgi:hypothetical protein
VDSQRVVGEKHLKLKLSSKTGAVDAIHSCRPMPPASAAHSRVSMNTMAAPACSDRALASNRGITPCRAGAARSCKLRSFQEDRQ